MARPRKPSCVLELQGAYDKNPQRRHPDEPKPASDLGDPPAHLSDEQIGTWREIVSQICPGVLGNSDAIAVEITAVLLAQFRANPEDFTASRIAQLSTLLGKFGMTPADRSRVIPAEAPARENPFARNGRKPGA